MAEAVMSVQRYLEKVTGKYFQPGADIDSDIEFAHKVMRQENVETDLTPIWDFPYEEKDYVVENKLNVVLVDCLEYDPEKGEYEHVTRWFEVPEEVKLP